MKPATGAAVLSCGLVLFALAREAATLPEAGPLAPVTVARLLITDAGRVGTRIVAVGDRGYIALSDDHGRTWKRARAPAAPLLTAVDFAGEQLGLAVGHDSVVLLSRDRGETWTQVFSAPAEQRPLLDVAFVGAERAIAVGAYGAYYESDDGGRKWSARKVLQDDKHLNAIVDAGDGHLVLLGEAGTLLVSGDAGRAWTPVASPYKGSLFGGVVADDGAVIAFGMRGRIFRSTDKGRTWSGVDNASVASLMGADRLPDGALVVAGAAGTVLVSRDRGQSFVPLASGTTRAFSKALLAGPDEVLLAGEAGPRVLPLPSARRRAP